MRDISLSQYIIFLCTTQNNYKSFNKLIMSLKHTHAQNLFNWLTHISNKIKILVKISYQESDR